MKKHLLLLLPAFAMMACGGGSQGGGSDQNSDSTAAVTEEEQPSAPLFNYVEPQEEIAKIMWEKIQATYPDIKEEVAAAKKWQMDEELGDYFNGASQIERYPQKTRMIFHDVVDGGEGSIDKVAYFKLQCYQNNDGSWTGALISVTGFNEGEANFRTYLYKDGTITDNTAQTSIPKYQVQPLIKYINDSYRDATVLFDTIGFSMISNSFWPIRYDWNGEKFIEDPKAVVIANLIDSYGSVGAFRLESKPDLQWGMASNCTFENNVVSQAGEKLAETEFDGEKLKAITIYSPKIGFAQKIDYTKDTWGNEYRKVITSKPVAVGLPIKDAFDKADDDPEYTTEKKDGYYVVTRRTERFKYDKYDVMISLYAKDENSNIEKIRLFSVPLKVTLLSDLEDNEKMPDEIKDIWKKLDEQYKLTSGFGEFHNSDMYQNGFEAKYYDKGNFTVKDVNNPPEWVLSCYMFKTASGAYKILTEKKINNAYYLVEDEKTGLNVEFAEYVYENGKFTKTPIEIPKSVVEDYKAYSYDKTITVPGPEIKTDSETLITTIPLPDCCSGTSISLYIEGFRLRAATKKYEYYKTEAWDEESDGWYNHYYVYYAWDDNDSFTKQEYGNNF